MWRGWGGGGWGGGGGGGGGVMHLPLASLRMGTAGKCGALQMSSAVAPPTGVLLFHQIPHIVLGIWSISSLKVTF